MSWPVVVGLDTDSYGFHAVLFGEEAPVPWRSFRSKSSYVDLRRIEACEEARSLFLQLPPGAHIFAEEPLVLSKNGKTTRLLALMFGALWAQHLDLDVFWHFVDVAHWKREVCGGGNFSKAQVADWVRGTVKMRHDATVRMAAYNAHQDLYDAHCLAVYGTRTIPVLRGVA